MSSKKVIDLKIAMVTESKVFIIAEIGNNHEDFGLAKEMIHLASETGVDAVIPDIHNRAIWGKEMRRGSKT